ncbi:hypothetical protein [Capnocytophaga canimorsus]|uniref:hypothetical protein n=1 Tax=Capnocytophaga canimorsus TaxID=28188 RepID=UPI0037D00BF7
MTAIEQKQLKKELFKLQMKVVKLKTERSEMKAQYEAILKQKDEELKLAKSNETMWFSEYKKLKESANTDVVNA